MDLYHIWCDLEPGHSDTGFCESVQRYLGHLQDEGRIAGYRITRRKLGLAPPELGEFHVQIELTGLAQLDEAFSVVSARAEPIEELHAAVNQVARNLRFALYRDFPDPQRTRGSERF